MITVQLNGLVHDSKAKRFLAATREVELPTAPFIGLVLILSEIVHFEITRVEYDVNQGLWFAECADEMTSHPLETLEQCEDWYREAGFQVVIQDATTPPRRRRHLRPVRD